jgi:hypothetical protein
MTRYDLDDRISTDLFQREPDSRSWIRSLVKVKFHHNSFLSIPMTQEYQKGISKTSELREIVGHFTNEQKQNIFRIHQ